VHDSLAVDALCDVLECPWLTGESLVDETASKRIQSFVDISAVASECALDGLTPATTLLSVLIV